MKTEEQNLYADYLDPVKKRFPIFGNHVIETVLAFNAGAPQKLGYTAEEICCMGKQLARVVNQSIYGYYSDRQYDEKGNVIGEKNANTSVNQDRYEYQDGQIVVVTSKGAGGNETAWEYDAKDEKDEKEAEPMITGGEAQAQTVAEILEAKHVGDLVKAMRKSKKMSRETMAAKMNMTMARLGEIEGGDEPDEDELGEIAQALSVSKKKIKKLATELTASDDDAAVSEDREIEIEDDEIIIDDDDIEITIEASQAEEPKLFEFAERGVNPDTGRLETRQRLNGRILVEEITTKGMFRTMRFVSPMIVIDAYTANGNKYDRHCAEQTVRDINNMAEKAKTSEDTSPALSINFNLESEDDVVEVFDMQLTHNARIDPQKENELKIVAGKIVGAFLKPEDQTVYVIGETIPTTAGHDATVMIEEKILKYISLVSIPKKKHYEANDKGGLNVHEMKFFGADFTRNPAMPFRKGAGIKALA